LSSVFAEQKRRERFVSLHLISEIREGVQHNQTSDNMAGTSNTLDSINEFWIWK